MAGPTALATVSCCVLSALHEKAALSQAQTNTRMCHAADAPALLPLSELVPCHCSNSIITSSSMRLSLTFTWTAFT